MWRRVVIGDTQTFYSRAKTGNSASKLYKTDTWILFDRNGKFLSCAQKKFCISYINYIVIYCYIKPYIHII